MIEKLLKINPKAMTRLLVQAAQKQLGLVRTLLKEKGVVSSDAIAELRSFGEALLAAADALESRAAAPAAPEAAPEPSEK